MITWLASEFEGFRHGYAGTIYKGQGKTLDHTYLLHARQMARGGRPRSPGRRRTSCRGSAQTRARGEARARSSRGRGGGGGARPLKAHRDASGRGTGRVLGLPRSGGKKRQTLGAARADRAGGAPAAARAGRHRRRRGGAPGGSARARGARALSRGDVPRSGPGAGAARGARYVARADPSQLGALSGRTGVLAGSAARRARRGRAGGRGDRAGGGAAWRCRGEGRDGGPCARRGGTLGGEDRGAETLGERRVCDRQAWRGTGQGRSSPGL
jgi:hypothetical protein